MAQYLPDLPLIEIFRHLGLVDLARARAVSRRWRALIDGCVRIQELAICCNTKPIQTIEKWFYLNKAVHSDNVIELDVLRSGFSKFNQTIVRLHLLASLKRLRIVQTDERGFNGSDLDRLFTRLVKFTVLDHLEINFNFALCESWSSHALVHPNLRILSLGYVYEDNELDIEVDCPRLEILQCIAAFNQITITYPETIKQLYYYGFRNIEAETTASSSALAAFANVERFWCDSLDILEEVNIWSMPKLKELRVESDDWTDYEIVQWHRDILTGLIDAKKRLGSSRGSTKIFLNDVECSANLRESHPECFLSDEENAAEAD